MASSSSCSRILFVIHSDSILAESTYLFGGGLLFRIILTKLEFQKVSTYETVHCIKQFLMFFHFLYLRTTDITPSTPLPGTGPCKDKWSRKKCKKMGKKKKCNKKNVKKNCKKTCGLC